MPIHERPFRRGQGDNPGFLGRADVQSPRMVLHSRQRIGLSEPDTQKQRLQIPLSRPDGGGKRGQHICLGMVGQ